MFESAGYIFRFGFNLVDGVNNITEITIQRGWTALGGHLVWAYCWCCGSNSEKKQTISNGRISSINVLYFSFCGSDIARNMGYGNNTFK